MTGSLAYKILKEHLVEGDLKKGLEIGIKIDQTLTQDATGTVAYLQLEALGLDKVQTELSVSYVDHNTLQNGFENADDHLYLQSVAARFGIYFSRPGNGICHQVHLERFGIPGKTLLGSDSHTPTAGGLGMLGIGAGGLDVAVAMSGGLFFFAAPEVLKVNLKGRLSRWVGAKDIILELLRRLSVKGGAGKIIEYAGEGLKALSVQERATIANMGAELGATSSLFPSDDVTRRFMQAQGRGDSWKLLEPDQDAVYDAEISLDLASLEPLAAMPHSPDAVKTIREIGPVPVNQVAVGSCTNGSYDDLRLLAEIMKGRVVHPKVSLVVAPGSRQVFMTLAREGIIESLLNSGARILEPACGPCIGMGQAPPSNGVSLRTFNRNFSGRSGTADAKVYLVGPAAAAAAALRGELTDPRELGAFPDLPAAPAPQIDDKMIIAPPETGGETEIIRGPNIKPLVLKKPMPDQIRLTTTIIVGDNITTDHIIPGGSKVLPLRSNIEALSEYAFNSVDSGFPERARRYGRGLIVAGENYGQGSSREHAALVPMSLGVEAVLARSFARIHHANLVNFGILPLTFCDPADFQRFSIGDELVIENIKRQLNEDKIILRRLNDGVEIVVFHNLSARQLAVIQAGGLLNYSRQAN